MRNLISVIKVKNIVIFLLIYSILLFQTGFFFFQAAVMEGHIIIISLLAILCFVWKCELNKYSMMYAFALIALLLITWLYTGTIDHMVLVSTILYILEAAIISGIISYDEFKIGFINCLCIISIVSLIGFILIILAPSFVTAVFPKLINSVGNRGYYMLFAIAIDIFQYREPRNQGIFWEPGVFQIFLSLAFIFELYRKDEIKCRKRVLILFLITLVTTFSTTGLLVAMALVILALSRKKEKIKFVRLLALFFICVSVFILMMPFFSEHLKYTLIEKTNQFLNYKRGDRNSASVRFESVIYPLYFLKNSPILGIGLAGYEKIYSIVGHRMMTCTPVNWIARYGIIWGFIIYKGLFTFFKNLVGTKLETVFIFAIVCISLFSESIESNIIFLSLVFYGLNKKNNIC